MIGDGLAYVSVVVRDPPAVAALLAGATGAAVADAGDGLSLTAVGGVGIVLAPPGHPFVGHGTATGVNHIALLAEDLEGSARAAADAGLPPGPAVAGLTGQRRRLPTHKGHGVETWLAEPLALPASTGLLECIDHIGIASADNEAAEEVFCRRLGYRVESRQIDQEFRVPLEVFTSDKYGVVHKSLQPELIGGLRCIFVALGGSDLEFLQDLNPADEQRAGGTGADSTKNDKGAIARFVARRGAGPHHLAFKVADATAALLAFERAGARIMDRKGRPGGRRSQIGFVFPQSLGGLLVHMVERKPV